MAPLLSGTDPTEHIMISGELPAKIEFGKFLGKFASDMIKEGKGETLMKQVLTVPTGGRVRHSLSTRPLGNCLCIVGGPHTAPPSHQCVVTSQLLNQRRPSHRRLDATANPLPQRHCTL